MYTIGREHAKQAMLLGSLSNFWSGPAFSNPAMELWHHFPITRPYPSAHPQVIGLFVPVPLEGDDLMWLLPVPCSFVLLLVFQMLLKM